MFRKMFMFLFCLVIGSMLVVPAMGQTEDVARAVAVDSSGNAYVTGYSNSDFVTIKYDVNGSQIWMQRYNGPANSFDGGQAIAVDSSGDVYVTGVTDSDCITIKYAADGAELWKNYYITNYSDSGNKLCLDQNGNVYVIGLTGSVANNRDVLIIKYAADGTELWTRTYNSPIAPSPADYACDAVIDPLGENIYIAGWVYLINSGGSFGEREFLTLKYSADGTFQWAKTFTNDGEGGQGVTIAVSPSGENIYVAGYCDKLGAPDNAMFTIKYAADGTEQKVEIYDTLNASDIPNSIAVNSSGEVYVMAASYLNGQNYVVIKYSADLSKIWEASYVAGGSLVDGVIDASGNVYVTGFKHVYGWPYSSKYVTVKFNADGTLSWEKTYIGPVVDYNYANAIAIDPTGTYVAVTGKSPGYGTGNDYLSVMYNALDGSGAIVKRYDGVKGDVVNLLPIANAGSAQTVNDYNCPLGIENVMLNGSSSIDPDGASDIFSYSWTEGEAQIASGVMPTVSMSVGIHNISLTVTDRAGESSSDSVEITVNPSNPAAMIQLLIQDVSAVEAKNNTKGVSAKVKSASDAYTTAKGKNYSSTINKLQSFINQCNADNLLSGEDRARLIEKANCIIESINGR